MDLAGGRNLGPVWTGWSGVLDGNVRGFARARCPTLVPCAEGWEPVGRLVAFRIENVALGPRSIAVVVASILGTFSTRVLSLYVASAVGSVRL